MHATHLHFGRWLHFYAQMYYRTINKEVNMSHPSDKHWSRKYHPMPLRMPKIVTSTLSIVCSCRKSTVSVHIMWSWPSTITVCLQRSSNHKNKECGVQDYHELYESASLGAPILFEGTVHKKQPKIIQDLKILRVAHAQMGDTMII
jgi:hypothetical protein